MNFSLKTSCKKGFTIIELLVAISITAAITTLMLTIVINVLSAWNRSSATLTNGNQARLILDQLSVDLQGIILRRSEDVMLAATIQPNQGGNGDADLTAADWPGSGIKPGNSGLPDGSLHVNPTAAQGTAITNYRFGQAGVWLRFFTTPPDNSVANNMLYVSAPRAVSYQIIRRQIGSGSGPFSYQLFRAEVRPYSSTVAQQPYSTFGVGYDLFTAAAAGYNAIGSVGDINRADPNPGTVRSPDADQTIGDGVIDFGVRFYEAEGAVLKEVFPVDRRNSGGKGEVKCFAATTASSGAGAKLLAPYALAQTSYGYPTVAEVFLRILTPEGVNIIRNYEEDPTRLGGASASKWWELAEANSNVYIRRIQLNARPL